MRKMTAEEKAEYKRVTKDSEQLSFGGKIFGYARISTPTQSIERQIRNIKAAYPDAIIVKESFSGRSMNRPEWKKIYSQAKQFDTIVFDSVSRMSRTADEGLETYFELYDRGVELVFLKERYIDTTAYRDALASVSFEKLNSGDMMTDALVNGIMDAIEQFMKSKVKKDIEKAFEQSEKEVSDLRQRTKEGIETARLNGKQIGGRPGVVLNVKKKEPAKEKIKELSRSFDGTLRDEDVIKLVGISRNTYYKYKKELKDNI